MILSWGLRRKAMYVGVVVSIAVLAVLFLWVNFFSAPSTCFNKTQDGTERGVDCGGTCSLVCPMDTRAPIVLWARTFPTSDKTYTAAAYIQNNNGETAARGVRYTFQLFDNENKLVVEKDGVIDIPPVQTIPVVEQNIDVGNRPIARALFSFSHELVWQRAPRGSVPNIRVTKQILTPRADRLEVTIENTSLKNEKKITIVAVLFDRDGVARAASKSTVPVLESRSSVDVVFTWPIEVGDIQRAEISVLPSF